MPINPNIPLSVKPSRLGELALQFVNQRNQNQRADKQLALQNRSADRQDQALQLQAQRAQQANELSQKAELRQNRLLQIQEDSNTRKQVEVSRTNSLRDVGNIYQNTIEPMIKSDQGDPTRAMSAIDEIISGGQASPETVAALQGAKQQFQQDPANAVRVMKGIVRQAQSEKLIGLPETGEQINYNIRGQENDEPRGGAVNTRGQIVDSITRRVVPNAYKSPTSSNVSTGPLTKSGKNKAILEDTDLRISVKQNVTNIKDLKDLVARPEFSGGLTGDGIRLANSAVRQMSQLSGLISPIKGGKFDEDSAEKNLSKENLSKFRQAAITGDEHESSVSELSFIIAKSLNPDGKISDADVRQARVILGDGADVISRVNALEKLENRLVRNYNISGRTKREMGVLGDFKPLSIEGILNPDSIQHLEQNNAQPTQSVTQPTPQPDDAGFSIADEIINLQNSGK